MGWKEAYSGFRERVDSWIEALKPDETGPEVDLEYLRDTEYHYLTIGIITEHGEKARCDLCGRLYPVQEVPELIEHTAGHNDQGEAEIDPFKVQGSTMVAEEATWEV